MGIGAIFSFSRINCFLVSYEWGLEQYSVSPVSTVSWCRTNGDWSNIQFLPYQLFPGVVRMGIGAIFSFSRINCFLVSYEWGLEQYSVSLVSTVSLCRTNGDWSNIQFLSYQLFPGVVRMGIGAIFSFSCINCFLVSYEWGLEQHSVSLVSTVSWCRTNGDWSNIQFLSYQLFPGVVRMGIGAIFSFSCINCFLVSYEWGLEQHSVSLVSTVSWCRTNGDWSNIQFLSYQLFPGVVRMGIGAIFSFSRINCFLVSYEWGLEQYSVSSWDCHTITASS